MMKTFVIVSLLLVSQVTFSGSKYVALRNYYNKANPGKCSVPAPDNIVLKPGKKSDLKTICGQVKCLNRKGDVKLVVCNRDEYPIPADVGIRYPQEKNPIDPFPKCCILEIVHDGITFRGSDRPSSIKTLK